MLLISMLAGCAPSPVGGEGDADAGATTAPTATLASIQEHIFTPSCASAACHSASAGAGALDLSATEASWQGLIDVVPVNAAAAAEGWVLVAPGEPDASFLLRKMRDPGPGEGTLMPSVRLDESTIATIGEWIAKGAQP